LLPSHPAARRRTRERSPNGLFLPAEIGCAFPHRRHPRDHDASQRFFAGRVAAAHLRRRRHPRRNQATAFVSTDTLNEFLLELDRAGELVRVKQPVSVNLEMCEITDRVMKQPGGGKALLFERPILMDGTPSAFPVAINTFGSMRRMSMSMGVASLDEIGARITAWMELK